MKKKIFVTRRLLKENEEKLQNLFDVTLNKNDKIYSSQEIINGSKNYDGILSSVTDPISADTISKLSNSIKIIANGAVGFGNIDIQAAKEKGITVTNTPDVLTDATADIQILLLLGASRKAYEGRIAAETQSWKWSWDFLLGKQMSNKRLGILGMGRIGRAVAKRAKAFALFATALPILPIPKIPKRLFDICLPNKKSQDHFQLCVSAANLPS